MKRILFLVVTLSLLSIATAFSASISEDASSSATPATAKEDSSFAVSSDYFSTPKDTEDDSLNQDQGDDQRQGYRRGASSVREQEEGDDTVEAGTQKPLQERPEELRDAGAKEEREPKDAVAATDDKQGRDDKDKKEKKERKAKKDKKTTAKAPVKKTVKPVVEPSVLEKAMGENPLIIDRTRPQPYGWDQLTQFGYSFFKRGKDSFASQTDVPVGANYVVGPGDRLVVTLWGSINGTYKLDVNRSGEIVLPKVGAVKVAGVTYGELPAVLKASVARIYKDFQINVNLDKLRLIKVYVVGEVASPGDYNVTSLSTVISALSAAGGPTKSGSLRNIQINRDGKVVETVDLYDFFLKGDKGKDIRLQPGDTILVPVIGRVAGIVGNVKRPGIYELKGETSLQDLFALGGGINPTGYLQRVQLYRVQAHDKKVVDDFNLDLSGAAAEQRSASVKMQDLDLVNVLPIDSVLRGYVRLEGHVLRPGDYALKPGMKVSSLLQGDNLLPQYHAGAGQIIRLYPPDLHPEIVYFDVAGALKGDRAQDVELKEFDRVKIFSREQMEETPVVKVSGEVQKPGQIRYLENMTVRDLLMQAGNVKLSAYLGNGEITRVKRTGGTVTSYSIPVNLEQALKGGEDNIKLEPFDELTVRRIPNWAEATDRYVTLKGEVMFPGTYPIYKGERLSSVIARAGGFTDLAYLRGVRFTRENVRKLQQQRMDEALDRAQDQIIKLQSNVSQTAASAEEVASSKTTLDNLMRSIDILKTKKAEGRVLMEITSMRDLKGSMYDLELQGGDQLNVPSDPGGINVIGDVYNQSTVVTQRGHDLEWYLKQVGGPTGDADMDGIYVVKVDGSVISQANSSKFMFYNSFWGKKLDSGDTIIVPRQYEKTAWLRGAKDIASVIGNIAVTAGVLVAAGL
ncbi:SLBB domain-containing protein [Geomonas propionica]|uniref:SLBB domain-containing protein n=1 Tax=Geomonas propionica TaxID=2798582 RepID=A0ABS0YVE7_9BACT|nr:SLBB domain-containing protein [Geomonas propionica]MBJ6801931.1 SLBB domain-containing protein [Geomonas propionica]